MATRRKIGTSERAVRRDLQRVPREDRVGGTAALAIELARQLDLLTSGEVLAIPRDVAVLSGQLQGVLGTLAKLQEPAAVLDPVDELERQRQERRRRRLGDAAG